MILATTKVEDVDRFLEVFGSKGAVKRAEHGSKGSTVFRDPTEEDRQRIRHSITDARAYFEATIARRRQEPRDDLISAFVRAEEENQALTAPEILSLSILLLLGIVLTAGASSNWIVLGGTSSAALSESVLRQQVTTLTNAQVLALRATPITVATAPGAGKLIEFVGAMLIFDRTAVYSETDDNLAIKYTNGSGVQASATIEATGFVDAAADASITAIPASNVNAAVSNAALVIHNIGDGEYGGGNAANTIKVIVSYRVHTTGL